MFTVSGRLTPIELRILLYLVRSLKLKQYAGKYGCHDKWGHENATTQYDSSVTPGVHQNWKQISKNSSSGSANRSLKTTWQMFKKLFLKQSADWFFFSVQAFAFTFNATQMDFHAQGLRLFQSLKKSRLVTCIRVFIQIPSGIQKDTLWICANSKKISKKTMKIDSIMQPVKSLLLDKIFE